jgi:hypothetical protein
MINYHFALDPDKPDEGLAAEILDDWLSAGWNLEKIIVAVLLLVDQRRNDPNKAIQADDLRAVLYELQDRTAGTLEEANRVLRNVQHLLEDLSSRTSTPSQAAHPEAPSNDTVSPAFIDSLKKGVKRGMTWNDQQT